MPGPLRSQRRAVLAVIAALTIAMGVAAPPAEAAAGDRGRLLRLINDTRERHGLDALRLNAHLSRVAERHSATMIRQNQVYDPPNLQQILSRYPYDLGAATVACEHTLRSLHRALMHSEVHRSILLNPQLRRVGIGVLTAHEANRCGLGSVWATEIFYG
jgi:uncharacterized protein YkwD